MLSTCLSQAVVGLRPGRPLAAGRSKSAQPRRLHRLAVRAAEDERQGNTATQVIEKVQDAADSAAQPVKAVTENLDVDWSKLTAEQQKQLADLYLWLTQHPNAQLGLGITNGQDLQRTWAGYQALLWRPAELLNGRMAMVGFTTGVLREMLTGESIWQQLYQTPFAYLLAYGLVVVGALLNRSFGSPKRGIGPFTPTAELVNARAAMLGYAILAYVEYNQELRRAAAVYFNQLQHMQMPGINA